MPCARRRPTCAASSATARRSCRRSTSSPTPSGSSSRSRGKVAILYVSLDRYGRLEPIFGWRIVAEILDAVAANLEGMVGSTLRRLDVVSDFTLTDDAFIVLLSPPRSAARDRRRRPRGGHAPRVRAPAVAAAQRPRPRRVRPRAPVGRRGRPRRRRRASPSSRTCSTAWRWRCRRPRSRRRSTTRELETTLAALRRGRRARAALRAGRRPGGREP